MSSNITLRSSALNPVKLQELFRRHRIPATAALILLAMNVLCALFLVAPAYRGLVSEETSLRSDRSKVGELLTYREALEGLSTLEKMLFSQQDLARLADQLPAMAKRHRLLLPGVSYEPQRQKEGELRRVTLDFKLSGRYTDIRKFIHEVEGLDRFLYIQDMELASSGRKPEELDLKLRMVAVLG